MAAEERGKYFSLLSLPPEGEVWVIYTSLQWLDGKIETMMHVLTSHPKTKFLSPYSYLRESAGFMEAALNVLKLTVTRAIKSARNPDIIKIHKLRSIL
jgi:hypothetical protein